MEYIFGLDAIPEGKKKRIGGKAMSLSRMIQNLKVNVPYGYVLTADAVQNGKLTAEAEKELAGLICTLNTKHTYAVRSSALNEDGESASFAGQYETMTDVKVEDIPAAVNQVIASIRNNRVQGYTDAFDEKKQGIAVVIQRFVKPELAGVIFTSDVITGSDASMMGNYVHGEGEALVSGEKNAESFRIHTMPYGYEGNDEMKPYAKKLYRNCCAIKQEYGMPMDMEWAISDGILYMLQARPITTLRRLNKASYLVNGSLSGNKLLTRTNVGEIFMKPISPMTFSVLENINTFLGLSDWLDNIYGQPFMNVSVMCSLLVSFGMSKEKAFEQIKDLAGTIPKGVTIPISPFDKRVFLKHLQKLLFPKKKCKLTKAEKHQLMEEVPEICQKLISEIKRLNTNQELARYWNERLIPLLNDGLSAVMAVSGIHMLPLFTTRTQIEKVAGTDMANRLCGGCVGILDCMKPLLLIEDVVDGIISKEEYVRICGHRCVNEMELMEPRPYEHPGFPDNVIKEHVSNHVSIRRMQEKEQKAYEEALLEFKETYPGKRSWIEKKIEKFRHANQAREDLRNKGVLMFCVLREYILRIGAVNNLGDDVFMLMMDEMFSMIKGEWNETDVIEARKVSYGKYLNYPTFPSVVVGRFIPDEWLSDPDRRSDFYCADFVDEEREKKKQSDMEHGDKREVRGFPGAAGVVEGTVRRITDIKDMDQIQKGEILVTIATNIGWTLVFPKVAAIVTDIGAPLSHAAIVAREFGIPAVVGCTDATSILKTGDRVRVDGAKGCVTLL